LKLSESGSKKILNRMTFMLLAIGLIVGIALGYGCSYLVYHQENSRLQISLSALQSNLSIAQAEVSSLESELSMIQEEPIIDTSLLVNKSLPFEAIVGDNLVLGKITMERADLGTLPQGSTAEFHISISNYADRPQRLLLRVDGNASKLITFDVIEIVQPGSTAIVTVMVNASVEKGVYHGIIVISGVH